MNMKNKNASLNIFWWIYFKIHNFFLILMSLLDCYLDINTTNVFVCNKAWDEFLYAWLVGTYYLIYCNYSCDNLTDSFDTVDLWNDPNNEEC